MNDSRGLKDKVVVITGGCGDIGGATAQKLASLGARVIVFDLLEEETGKARAEEIGAVEYQRVDQGDHTQIQESLGKVAQHFQRIDILIGNAAVGPPGDLLDRTAEEWNSLLQINLVGCVTSAQAAVKQMLRQEPDDEGIRGKLLFTSSWVGQHPRPGAIDYCVSKAALDHLVRLTAQEYAAQGIRVNAVAPGILDAGLTSKAFQQQPELRQKFLASIPVEEFGTAEQIGDAFTFLCSRESNYMTGQILCVDGGCSLTKRT